MGHAFTSIRDAVETAAVLAGNYVLPGSSLVTDNLVSNGAQKNLNSTLGRVANLGTGLTGGGFGENFTGIPDASSIGAGYTNAANGLGGLFGDSSLGSDISNGISGLGSQFSNGLSDLYNGSDLQSGVNSLSNTFGLGSGDTGLGGDLSSDIFAPSSNASSAPGTVSSGFTPTASSGSSLGGGTVGGFFQDPGTSTDFGNSASGFFSPDNQALDNTALSGNLGATGNVLSPAINDYASSLSEPVGSSLQGTSTAANNFYQPAIQSFAQGAAGGNNVDLSSIFGGGGNGAGALRAGLSTLFNQNPYKGSPQVANTLNASASQYNPFVQGGTQAQNQLSNLYGLNGQDAANSAQQDWQNTPGYQFQLNQGLGALQNSAAAQGGLLNGNTGEALQNYGQGLAGTTYQQYLSNLQNQAGQGQNALGSQASLQGQAAQLQQQPGQYKANQLNQGIGGLLANLFH